MDRIIINNKSDLSPLRAIEVVRDLLVESGSFDKKTVAYRAAPQQGTQTRIEIIPKKSSVVFYLTTEPLTSIPLDL